MEQIMPNWTIVIQAVIFIAALVIIRSFILTPVSQVLSGRSERIEGAEAEARRLEEESATLDASYRDRIRAGRAQAHQVRSQERDAATGQEREILGKARQEAQNILEGMRVQIRAESGKARTQLEEQATAISRLLTEKLLGRSVN